MSALGIAMMVVVLGGVWGAFVWLLVLVARHAGGSAGDESLLTRSAKKAS